MLLVVSVRTKLELDNLHSPCSLYTELLEESGGNDTFGGSEGVWVKKSAANDTDYYDAESASERLRRITDNSSCIDC